MRKALLVVVLSALVGLFIGYPVTVAQIPDEFVCRGSLTIEKGHEGELIVRCLMWEPYTETPTLTLSPTNSYTPTSTESNTPTNTSTPIPTDTPTSTPTYTPTPEATFTPTPIQPKGQTGWNLVFQDEFEGTQLDLSKWVYCNWNNWYVVYHQCKSFTPDGIELNLDRNVKVEYGLLTFKTQREDFYSDFYTKWYTYTSGMISTATKFYTQPPFYMEARIKFPNGQGLWGAWWSTRKYEDVTDKVTYQEIDVIEYLNKAYTTFHKPESGSYLVEGNWGDAFHVYGGLVEPGHAQWYYDGQLVRDYVNEAISSYNMYLVLQEAVGGGWGGMPDGSWEQVKTEIDYVRVWKR